MGYGEGTRKGDFKFVLRGKRLRGSWVLVRTRRDERGKAQWLLIKHRDEFAAEGSDVTAEHQTSVATRRTMEEIGGGKSRVWHSNRTENVEPGEEKRSCAAAGSRVPRRLLHPPISG